MADSVFTVLLRAEPRILAGLGLEVDPQVINKLAANFLVILGGHINVGNIRREHKVAQALRSVVLVSDRLRVEVTQVRLLHAQHPLVWVGVHASFTEREELHL